MAAKTFQQFTTSPHSQSQENPGEILTVPGGPRPGGPSARWALDLVGPQPAGPWPGGTSAWWALSLVVLGQVGPWPGGPSAWWSSARWDLGLVGPWPGGPSTWWSLARWALCLVGPRHAGPWPGETSAGWALHHHLPSVRSHPGVRPAAHKLVFPWDWPWVQNPGSWAEK